MGVPFFHPPPRKPKISGNRVTRRPCKTIPPLGRAHHALCVFVLEEKMLVPAMGCHKSSKAWTCVCPEPPLPRKRLRGPVFLSLHFIFVSTREGRQIGNATENVGYPEWELVIRGLEDEFSSERNFEKRKLLGNSSVKYSISLTSRRFW